MHIHFVCSGNAYRSRLAEVYLKSKKLPNVTVSSSGTEADKYHLNNGTICWYAMRLIRNHKLIPYMKPNHETTTKQSLAQANLVIFLGKSNYEFAQKNLGYHVTNYQIWEVVDLDSFGFTKNKLSLEDDIGRMKASEKTFDMIRQKVDELITNIGNFTSIS